MSHPHSTKNVTSISSNSTTIENEGRFDFGKVILKRENVVSISTPFKSPSNKILTTIGKKISYIVSEDFFEQFTALAFIDFKRRIHFYAPPVEYVMKKTILAKAPRPA